ncbi:MAG: rRNA maturation RNase YbeY [Phototrophicaceae bacterium]
MPYHIEINNEASYAFDLQRLQQAILTVLTQHDIPHNREVGVEVVNNQRIQELNRNFRQVNKPTDVLSFPAEAEDLPDVIQQQMETVYLGDLAIAYPYATHQAEQLGCSIDDNLALLAIHGTLHLLGYDHDTPSNRAEMWTAQDRALSALGVRLDIVPALEEFSKSGSVWSRWLEDVTSTMQIEPSEYALKTSANRLDSLGYALAGWLYMLRHQRNTWIMAIVTPLIGAVALWLGVDRISWALLIVAITLVWLTEFVNASVEASIDLSTSEYHPMAKVGKDVASAAVLLGVIASVLIGLLVLAPPLWQRLQGWFTLL